MLISLADTQVSSGLLQDMHRYINRLLTDEEFVSLDQEIQSMDVSRILPVYLVGLLRITFAARHMIPGWVPFRDRVVRELDEIHAMDSARILRGLL